MRKCLRCQSDMIEGLDFKIDGASYGITLAENEKIFAKRIGKPKVAVCPNCGEISIYLENTEQIKKAL